MLPEPNDFVAAMAKHWECTLKNQSSQALKEVWHQIASTLNRQIERKMSRQWQVLQPPTGTGKTQGIAVYCSMLSKIPVDPMITFVDGKLDLAGLRGRLHPGVLIVTRFTDEADNLAKQINTLSGVETAKSHHRKKPLTKDEMVQTPVLVVSHSAYQQYLRRSLSEDTKDARLPLREWQLDERSLVIIDEALDLCDEAQVDIEALKHTISHIPEHVGERCQAEVSYLKSLLAWMKEFTDDNRCERMLPPGSIISHQPSFQALRCAMRGIRLDREVLHKNDLSDNMRLHDTIKGTLDGLEMMAEQWSWYAKSGQRGTLNTARFILPEDHRGAVVMDATASPNLIYRLFRERASIVPTPEGARRYDNVTLHLSRNHKVGKVHLKKNAKQECSKLISHLKMTLPATSKVFICCHKDVRPHLEGYESSFEDYRIAHWGAVDGRNDWDSSNVGVVFGLPYRNRTWSANTFMAMCGEQSSEWLNSSGQRPFEEYSDIREALEHGAIASSVIQAINRTQCRRVVDGNGNCHPTDVYLPLPNGDVGEAVLAQIERAMPGIRTVPWAYEGASRRVRRSSHETALLQYLADLFPGRTPVREVLKELGISQSTFERLVARNNGEPSSFHERMAELGLTYEVTGKGRGARSHFVKVYKSEGGHEPDNTYSNPEDHTRRGRLERPFSFLYRQAL